MTTLLNLVRAGTLVLLAAAVGMMVRYYLTRPQMPWTAFVGFVCYAIAAAGGLMLNLSRSAPFKWWLTPFVFVGSVAIIVGAAQRLRWRRGDPRL